MWAQLPGYASVARSRRLLLLVQVMRRGCRHPAWPGRVSVPTSARQKRELDGHPGWILITFIGDGDWAVVPSLHVEVCDRMRPWAKEGGRDETKHCV